MNQTIHYAFDKLKRHLYIDVDRQGDSQMKAQRKGSNMLVAARLKIYDEALKSGKTSEEAFKIAKAVTRKQIGKVRGK